MAIKFQYNKTSLQQIEKQLKMRQRTLPIIKNKETALRLEVKRCKEEVEQLEEELQRQIAGYESMYALWGEFDASLVEVKDVEMDVKKIAGVRVPVLKNIRLEAKPFGIFSAPKWYFDGINLLHGLAMTAVKREFAVAKCDLLDHARRKTTQKVNLFEKVQIPGFQEAVRKIKRFMEDEENLSKSSQKILKALQEKRAEEEAAASGASPAQAPSASAAGSSAGSVSGGFAAGSVSGSSAPASGSPAPAPGSSAPASGSSAPAPGSSAGSVPGSPAPAPGSSTGSVPGSSAPASGSSAGSVSGSPAPAPGSSAGSVPGGFAAGKSSPEDKKGGKA